MPALHEHEELSPAVSRWAVPGGWIYRVEQAGLVFVPEPPPVLTAATATLQQPQHRKK